MYVTYRYSPFIWVARGRWWALVRGSEMKTGQKRVSLPPSEYPPALARYPEFWGPSWGTTTHFGPHGHLHKKAEALVFKGLPQYAVRDSNPEPTD